MIVIDGTTGEGGGQILRTALALSVVTGKPFQISKIRGRRERPGLRRQHLTAVMAAARVGAAHVQGAELGSRELHFEPSTICPGEHRFAVGTAGSAGLVLQTVLPALLVASAPSRLLLEGGTHNPGAPPFDFLARVYLPLVGRMGPLVTARLERPGFYPAGGGRFVVEVEPVAHLAPLHLAERGRLLARRARVLSARLPAHVARREQETVARLTGWDRSLVEVEEVHDSAGPGNAVMLEVTSEHVTELFTAFGARGVPAEAVATAAAEQALAYLDSGVPVGPQLADQLLLPLAIAGGGSFVTVAPTLHATTNADVISRFLDVRVSFTELAPSRWRVKVASLPS